MDPDSKIAEMLRVPRVLWTALMASLGIYVLMLYMVRWREGAPPLPHPPDPVLLPVLSLVATTVAVMSFVMPRFLMKTAARGAKRPRPGEPIDPDLLRSLLPRLQTPFILGCALSEAVALFGFVLGFLGFPPLYVAPFFVAGAVLMAVRFPTPESFMSVLPE
jgi:hypothetical protein